MVVSFVCGRAQYSGSADRRSPVDCRSRVDVDGLDGVLNACVEREAFEGHEHSADFVPREGAPVDYQHRSTTLCRLVPLDTANESLVGSDVPGAYTRGDPHALLCLELKWIEGAGLDAARLCADKLRARVELLKEQASELEAESYQLRFHPRYAPLIVAGPLGVPVLVDGPREVAKLDEVIESLRIDVERVASDEAITLILETLHAYREARQAQAQAAHRRRSGRTKSWPSCPSGTRYRAYRA
jgi:hypothetical protein